MWWLTITETIIAFLAALAVSRYYVHMLQLESYQLDGMERWFKKNPSRGMTGWTLYAGLASSAACLILPIFTSLLVTGERTRSVIIAHALAIAFFVVFTAYHVIKDYRTATKKKLVFTKRVWRLYAVLAALVAIALVILILLFRRDDTADSKLVLMWVPPFMIIVAAPYITPLAARVAQPIETRINHGFYVSAQNKIKARGDLIVVGVTGSYGKTTTKFILETLLSEKFTVLAPQASINTPMGLSKVINNDLEARHQVFIAEMGARHVGDIKELVELTRPKYGVITSVGAQHLETFGDIATVANTKYELIEGLPKDGCAFFAADDGEADKLYARCRIEKKRAGMGAGLLDARAEDIETGAFGSRFTLVEADGARARCETKLLGRHNIQNVVLCCAVARKLGLSMDQIIAGVNKIKPVKHRLELIPGAVSVIDDAFNSNPVGAKEALNVLNSFPGSHVVVTPGFVELGEEESAFNYRFGTQLAQVCDAVILVGAKRTLPIKQGMLESGFSSADIHVVNTLAEATKLMPSVAGSGDAVLFENDLPDNYT